MHDSPGNAPEAIDAILAGLAGVEIDGGCDDCPAYATVWHDGLMWHLTTHHDDACPWWKAYRGGDAA